MRIVAVLLILMLGAASHAQTLSHGRFKDVNVYRPDGAVKRVVLFLSGRDGWTEEVGTLARGLARDGAFVAGIDTPSVLADFERDGAGCVYPDGDLENLSRFLQAYYRLPAYRAPVLVGYESGASFAYSVLAQAPADTFAGGVALHFCPEPALMKPLCGTAPTGGGVLPAVQLDIPWFVTPSAQCDVARLNRFVAAVRGEVLPQKAGVASAAQLAAALQRIDAEPAAAVLPMPGELGDLPIVEVPAQGSGDRLAVLITGDGGWAGIDKQLASALSKRGVAVVGLDSLRYFWKARTPQSTAADVDRILRYYLGAWKKQRALLIGYSQGADVLPFVVNRLSSATRSRVQQVALLAPAQRAVFEFHLASWLRVEEEGQPLLPEMRKLTETAVLCVYGVDEENSPCPRVPLPHVRAIGLSGGHHFDGDYERLARLILDQKTP
jgi:type IV secretory pathway VirJ component